MKFLKIFFVVLVFAAGYALGNSLPWSGFSFVDGGNSILGPARLEVTVLMDNGTPVPNLEVGVAEKPGPPKRGGTAITGQNGVAAFDIQPGDYFIIFNENNFPQNLAKADAQPVHVAEDNVNKKTIILTTKKDRAQ